MVKVLARAMFEPSSSSSDDFEILADDADTEESDAPTDPELGPADYWTCIKCKNGNNNPMYRFCEKCFQVITTCTFIASHHICINSRQLDNVYETVHSNMNTTRHACFA